MDDDRSGGHFGEFDRNSRPESFRPQNNLEALRVPPQSVEAEQAVIGGLMLAPDAIDRVGDLLTEADFYRRDHRLIYRGIRELSEKNKPFDAVTLGEWFDANGLSEQIGGPSYLIELASTTPSAANVRAYAEIVREKSVFRQLIEAGTDIVNDGFQPEGEEGHVVLAKAQGRLLAITADRGKGGLVAPKSGLKRWFHGLQDRWNAGQALTGLSTPYAGMDDITHGLQGGDLVILASRPGMGKTVAGASIAEHVAQHHGPSALFELEMSQEQLLQRLVARRGRVPHEWLRSPRAFEAKHELENPDSLWATVSVMVKELAALPLLIDDTARLGVEQIVSRARRAHREAPLKLIVVDHLHLVELPGRDTVTELGNVSGRLKALAKETGACVLALAQLNRANRDRTDKRPTMADLRASGALEQDADEIWFVHREEYYDKHTHLKGVAELINGKSRNAPMGETVYLRNRLDQMRFEDWEGDLPKKEAKPAKSKGFKKAGAGKEAALGDDA